MSDIFISYAREDRAMAQRLAQALQRRGWSVWWDREIVPGQTFDREIEHALDAARAVVVLWSPHAVASDWVRNEAGAAQDRGVLVPALIDGSSIPLAFRRNQAAMLAGWQGEDAHEGWQALRKGIARLLGERSSAVVGSGDPALVAVAPPTTSATSATSAPPAPSAPRADPGPAHAPVATAANPAGPRPVPAAAAAAQPAGPSRRPLWIAGALLALLIGAGLWWSSTKGPADDRAAPSGAASPGAARTVTAAAQKPVPAPADGAPVAAPAVVAADTPAAKLPGNDSAAIDLANRVAGRFAGDIIADSQGPSRQGVALVVTRIDARHVRITSPDEPRLAMASMRLSLSDASTVLGESSDTPFIAKLAPGGVVSLSYAPRNQLSFSGSRQPP